ncbi:MAG: HAD family phosphatase [Trueperaceae bacterium]|nr:HAD family phosphatase [Trueperaceae bacterium]
MRLTDFEAVLFDMDGTLVDSESLWRIAEIDTVAQFGATLEPEVQARFPGTKVETTAAMMVETYNLATTVEHLIAELEKSVKKLLPSVEDKPGAVKLIETVAGLELPKAIVSNSSIDIIETTLAGKSWAKHFPLRFSAEQVKQAKPAPDLYLLASKRLKVKPTHSLVFEDSLTGVKAAVAAGTTCIAIPEHNAEAFKELTPHVFESLEDALEALAG